MSRECAIEGSQYLHRTVGQHESEKFMESRFGCSPQIVVGLQRLSDKWQNLIYGAAGTVRTSAGRKSNQLGLHPVQFNRCGFVSGKRGYEVCYVA